MRVAAFGEDVEVFLHTEIGKYLIGRAEEQRGIALEALAQVDPENPKAIRDQQFRIMVADSIQTWLAEAITDSRNAKQILFGEET